jgi:hypothetical protein
MPPVPPRTHALLVAIGRLRTAQEHFKVPITRVIHDAVAEYAQKHFPGTIEAVIDDPHYYE